MKTKTITLAAMFVALIGSCSTPEAQNKNDFVTIKGKVTDYNNNPLKNVSVNWLDPTFRNDVNVVTDSLGDYSIKLEKGRYYCMGAINMDEYPNAGSTLPDLEQRLEFWGWNFIADRDTTFNIKYHRMEVYGVNIFQIQGAVPGYTIYCRPMALTRCQAWHKGGDQPGFAALAPPIDKAKITITINDEEVKIKMAQEVKEYFSDDTYSNAYLLFVDHPEQRIYSPYETIRIYIEDTENGDKGEATYHFESKSEDYVWLEGNTD